MSENIQSISNGTFTIGQTSATNFQAGPGISITQPSEGTVRIANDETVLWSNDLTANSAISAFITNEKVSNFERIRFEGYVNGGYFVSEIPNYSIIDNTLRFGTVAYSLDNYGSPLEMYGVSYTSNNGTSFTGVRTTLRWCNQTITSALQGTTAATWPVIGKIIGINRISGGNA